MSDNDIADRMLAGLAEGRRRAIVQSQARAAALRKVVLQAARDDQALGKQSRGRAGRIACKLHGLASRRHVQRILDTFSSMSNSSAHDAVNVIITGHPHE